MSLGPIVWEKSGFLGLCAIQILKVTYMSYLSPDFEGFTNKIQSFQRFQNFRTFRVWAKTKRQKPEVDPDFEFDFGKALL